MKAVGATIGIVGVVAAVACAQVGRGPRFATEHEWMGQGHWVRGDTHVHTRASDGAYEIDALITRAKQHGCEALAITDHADRNLRAATPEYMSAINAARINHRETIVVAGLEWNVPPYEGREHMALLAPDDPNAGALLAEFKQRFDDLDRPAGVTPKAAEALDWLVERARNLPVKPVLVYNHPSRKDESAGENLDDVLAWHAVNDVVIGFEGAPGHQGKLPFGDYGRKHPTIDRWDPAVATPGGAWDTLLQRGYDVVGALASSDFHTDSPSDLNDFWPCQFAENWFYVPDKTVDGLLRAMRAGTFYGVHGRIVRDVEMVALVEGLSRSVMVGESAQVIAGTEIPVVLNFNVPELDWQQQPNKIDTVEFIVITPTAVDVRTHKIAGKGAQTVTERITASSGGAVVRARLRREIADGPDLMAYTNPIRIRTR